MTQIVSVDEAKETLQDLLARALAGNEVIITEHGKPVARLVAVPVAPPRKKRVPGLNRGAIWTSEDFDQPLPDEFWLGHEWRTKEAIGEITPKRLFACLRRATLSFEGVGDLTGALNFIAPNLRDSPNVRLDWGHERKALE